MGRVPFKKKVSLNFHVRYFPKGLFRSGNFSKCAIFQAITSQVCPSRSARAIVFSSRSAQPPSPSQPQRQGPSLFQPQCSTPSPSQPQRSAPLQLRLLRRPNLNLGKLTLGQMYLGKYIMNTLISISFAKEKPVTYNKTFV